MYNLIMQYVGYEEGLESISESRVFEHPDTDIQRAFTVNDGLDLEALSRLPTLFAPEQQGVEPQFARVGRILNPRRRGRDIDFDVVFERGVPPIALAEIIRLARHLHISTSGRGLTEMNRIHWAVKDVDLFRVLYTEVQPPTRSPNVLRMPIHPQIERNLVSVMMPFAPAYNPVFHAIQTACVANQLACTRADNIWDTPAVIDDVANLIDRSAVVIFDCSGKNANVFYELGLAHAWGKEVVILTSDPADIPFDLRHLRFLQYDMGNLALLSTQLSLRLRELTV
ncbi:hypothetical protein ACIQAL_03745 [Pseudomonas sp. NPDC088368]|uniref:hypothetical protein n=1 Tax=Pseudomonas sp. NPDC088368 TaxID=3364453 RepID=UPI00382FC72D